MPIYEYLCNACNVQFDLLQKFSDPPADRCPKCDGTVRKLVSTASFSLKGAGWFGDGYGTKAESTKSEGDKAAVTGDTTGVKSTDAAPATAETTASTATQASAPIQTETKSKGTETATTRGKAEVKSITSDAVS